MQSLFWISQVHGGDKPIKGNLIKLALRAYRASGDRTRVHQEISDYVTPRTAFQKDQTLEKIISLVHQNRFQPPESYRAQARAARDEEDDDWAGASLLLLCGHNQE